MIKYQTKQITIFESALFRTTSTLIQTPDLVLLVDPTWLPLEIKAIREMVDTVLDGRPLYLLFTHSDYDHIIAWNAFPEATTIASAAFVDQPDKASILDQILKFDDSNYIARDYKIAYPKIDIVISEEGQQLKIGETILTFYQSAGHNSDGLFTIIELFDSASPQSKAEQAGIWIAGDYLSNIEFPYIYHSSLLYEAVLNKVDTILENHSINLLIPGHGDFTSEQQEIKRRKSNDLDYIRRLRKAIKSGENPTAEDLYRPILFPLIMDDFHQKNIELIKKELNSSQPLS